jgi:RHS repeat-associated protein
VQALQPKKDNNHAVYLTTPVDTLSYHYERNPADPRISHTLTLGIDDHGNVTDSVAIGYPRRVAPDGLHEQGETHIVYTHTDFINTYQAPIDTTPAFYYASLPCQTRTYEITGMRWQSGQRHFEEQSFTDILDKSIEVNTQSFMPYEWVRDETDTEVRRRIIEWTRNYYRADADPDRLDPVGTLSHRLPLGEVESLVLPYEAYQAAFTNALLQHVYQGRTAGINLPEEGGYHPHLAQPNAEGSGDLATYWWIPAGRASFDAQKFLQATRAQDPCGNVTSSETDVYALLVETVRDALPAPQTNVVSAINDYRVLQPSTVIDPNGNRSQVVFDALGLVVGTAVMGEDAFGNRLGDSLDDFVADLPPEVRNSHMDDPLNLDPSHDTNPHHLLAHATTRLVYDLHRFTPEAGQPPVVYTLARETHVSDEDGIPSKIQHTFTYSDGFGRVSQTKVQAEPADPAPGEPTQPRWVGTGTTVYNNKGKAVRQFEPFFSPHQHYGLEQHGVSPTMFYDPSERVVCTLHPNHTYEKVVFDPWRQETWDVNDTVLVREDDPKNDSDVGDFFRHLPDADYLPTWYAQRQDGAPPQEQDAARKAAVHAATPTVAYADTLGRTFLTVAHNKFKDSHTPPADRPTEEFYHTRVIFDIEGNQRAVIDAKDRVVMRYDYDMLGNRIHQLSMDAGERWMLNDVTGQPIRAWDSRAHQFHNAYDPLRRPVETSLREGTGPDLLIGRMVYGESRPNPEADNLRGKVVQVFDQAGVVTTDKYDFKGNLLRSQRQLAEIVDPQGTRIPAYKTIVDWSGDFQLEADNIYTSSTRYDALNRPTEQITPDTSIYHPTFNEANLLERVDVELRGPATATPFVTNIDYNAKGQRERIVYGNAAVTEYSYDDKTFRLLRLRTTRPRFPEAEQVVQDLHYTYDAVGNITTIRDEAQQTIYFHNTVAEPHADYTYDALYRLIVASGREHQGQTSNNRPEHRPEWKPQYDFNDATRMNLAHPHDGQAMRPYTERYEYDEVGNILKMLHSASEGNWTRHYQYAEDSNRLLSTSLPGDGDSAPYSAKYEYDVHGNMNEMPHLPLMQWDYKDQLQATSQQVRTDGGTPETTYYVYDAAGQRVRKVSERQNGKRKDERVYLGGYEVYRQYDGAGTGVILERQTLHVMDDQQRIALVETKTMDNGVQINAPTPVQRFQFGNHLGSASLELGEHAQIVAYEEYYPYGSTSYQAGRSAAEVSLKRYRYTGMERDEETGFTYHGARYYAPWLGRWMSCDPIGVKDGPNLYAYCSGNPINRTDIAGTEWEFCNPRTDDECGFLSTLSVIGETGTKEVLPRVLGGVKAAAGLGGMVIGAGLCETGLGCIVGAPLMAASADVGGSGLSQVWHGDPQPTAVGYVLGPEAQSIEEDFVTIAGLTYTGAQGYAMLKTGQPLNYWARMQARVQEAHAKATASAPSARPTVPPSQAAPRPPTIPSRLPGYLSDHALVARSKAIFEKVATSILRAEGKQVTEGAIRAMKKHITIGVLQGHKNGKLVTGVTVQDPKYADQVRAALASSEEFVAPIAAIRINARTGLANKTGYANVHSEQTLAGWSRDVNLISPRVATSNNGCQNLCISNLSANFPEVRHVNPSKNSK